MTDNRVRHPSNVQHFVSAHNIKCQICTFCLVLYTINSCFPLCPKMVSPAKGSYLAFGTSANAEFVQNLLLGLWGCGRDLDPFTCTI